MLLGALTSASIRLHTEWHPQFSCL